MKDFLDAFRDLKQQDLNNLLQELKRAGKVIHEGLKKVWILGFKRRKLVKKLISLRNN